MTNTSNLPELLRQHGQFCLWKYEPNPDKPDKPRKMPYNPHYTWEHAETNNPATFSDLKTAEAEQSGFDGLGIRVDGGISGIDIDNCVVDGELSAMAQDIKQQMDCYTEYSPSGKGIRILFLAPSFSYDKEKYYIKRSDIGLEVYISGMTNRYLTVTGNAICKGDLKNRADRLQYILDKYMQRQQATAAPAPRHSVSMDLSDNDLIEKAKAAKNGQQFSSLWEGDFASYPSQSEADQALCNLLAFWTGRDAVRIDNLFRQSGLYRKKWERRDYRESTIKRAISNCQEVYTPRQEKTIEAPQKPHEAPKEQSNKQQAPEKEKPQAAQEASQKPQTRDSVALFDDFMGKVQTKAYEPLQTGMQAFDRLLGGGIQRQALVILSAAPGTGKTTLVQQIFETMAAHGTDVIFLNLEMSREQLLARSLSRMIHRDGGSITASGILKGYAWTDEMRRYIEPAAARYRAQIAPCMHYNPEGCGTMLSSIIATLNNAAAAAKAAGKPAPVCVLDYLHLVTMEQREDQQEIIKKTVAALKQYAIENDTFVLAISANNRTSNSSGTVTLESGRDSSALEYTADIQLSLNYRALHEKSEITYTTANGRTVTEKASAGNPDHMEALQKEKPRKMLVQVLKNRMTEPGGKLYLNFDAANSEFIAVDTHIQAPAGFIKVDDPDLPDF